MINIQKRSEKEMKALGHFFNNCWVFDTTTLEKLKKTFNDVETKTYGTPKFDAREYFMNFSYGARRYLLKQSDKDLPAAIKLKNT
jgi:hypothetical protein